MQNNPSKQTSRWLIYAVALLSGLTLGITLVFIAWNSALEENKRDFSFESSKIRESVAHNVQVSNDIINSFATFIDANKIFDEDYSKIGDWKFQNNDAGKFLRIISRKYGLGLSIKEKKQDDSDIDWATR